MKVLCNKKKITHLNSSTIVFNYLSLLLDKDLVDIYFFFGKAMICDDFSKHQCILKSGKFN